MCKLQITNTKDCASWSNFFNSYRDLITREWKYPPVDIIGGIKDNKEDFSVTCSKFFDTILQSIETKVCVVLRFIVPLGCGIGESAVSMGCARLTDSLLTDYLSTEQRGPHNKCASPRLYLPFNIYYITKLASGSPLLASPIRADDGHPGR